MISEAKLTPAAGETESRLRFGLIAAQYDRVRPGYPEELIDAVMEYGALAPPDRALDVGAGTGQATIQFAARGLNVLALEPSAEMVQFANDKFARAGLDAVATVGEFETAPLQEDAFALVYAATAWHWLDPDVCFEIAARAIAPGGTLAVLSTWPLWRRSDLRPALDRVYESSGAPPAAMGPMCPVEPDPGALAAEWMRETNGTGALGDQMGKLAAWSVTYTAQGYVDLLGTYGDHIGLEPDVRGRLFDGVRDTVEAAGGTIEVGYSTLLLLARALQ
ncbi:MAG TPA: class I SAM-dependent methyltransferase [Solirubrobacteraceae bacterium]|nr:class I SAM-dependent methyltransferase [Solirubrobacteraceae bacterium]